MPRMKILNNLEREAFEALPLFNAAERKQFFAMPKIFIDMMKSLRTPTHQVFFTITVGYFKAERRFLAENFVLLILNLWHTNWVLMPSKSNLQRMKPRPTSDINR